jgi:hypothetical protein
VTSPHNPGDFQINSGRFADLISDSSGQLAQIARRGFPSWFNIVQG